MLDTPHGYITGCEHYPLNNNEVLSYIADLQQQLKQREWISVDDRLPSERSIAYTPNNEESMRWRFIPSRMFKQIASEATHWMPLPTPPKEQEQ